MEILKFFAGVWIMVNIFWTISWTISLIKWFFSWRNRNYSLLEYREFTDFTEGWDTVMVIFWMIFIVIFGATIISNYL